MPNELVYTSVVATIVGGPYDGETRKINTPLYGGFVYFIETCRLPPIIPSFNDVMHEISQYSEGHVKYYLHQQVDDTWRLHRENTPPKQRRITT